MPFVVASLPGRGRRNPYVDLFYDALLPTGIELYGEPVIDLPWAREHFDKIDALHFHWPEWIWQQAQGRVETPALWRRLRARVPGAWRMDRVIQELVRSEAHQKRWKNSLRPQAVARFAEFLRAARLAGVKVLWTMHNVEAHESLNRIDRDGFRALARSADLIICHGADAKAACLHRHRPTCPVLVMPHGNYDGWYPQPRARADTMRDLGLDPDRPLVGCVGALRDYKGLDVAVQAARRLGGGVQLLVAGLPHRSFSLPDLERLVTQTPGVTLVSKGLSDQEFADCCAACDAVLLPYRKITGSGALLAALTLGRGVVASDLPYFRELLGGSADAGLLVPADDPEALAAGVKRYLSVDPARRTDAALGLAAKYAWPKVVEPVVKELRLIQAGSHRHPAD